MKSHSQWNSRPGPTPETHGTVVAVCVLLLTLLVAPPAGATLCKTKHVTPDHRTEANRVDRYPFGRDAYEGDHDYNSRVLGCNRHRDLRSPAIERTDPRDRSYPNTLPPRLIKGRIRYFNFAPMRYGYRLERHHTRWILTAVLRFHFPSKKFPNRLDIPLALARQLGIRNTICDSTQYKQVAGIDRGLIEVDGNPSACRLNRDEVIDGTPITEHYMEFWRDEITDFWSRAGFEVRMLITNLDLIPSDELRDYERHNIIWEVRLNHNKNSRAMYKASVGRPQPIYAGIDPQTVVHEFGHSIGLDDEYPGSRNPPPHRDCHALGGSDYVMCNSAGTSRDQAKGIYAWIATRRYGIGEDTTAASWAERAAAARRRQPAEPEDIGNATGPSGEGAGTSAAQETLDRVAGPSDEQVNEAVAGGRYGRAGALQVPDGLPVDEEVRDLADADSRDIGGELQRPSDGSMIRDDRRNPALGSNIDKRAVGSGQLIAHFPLDDTPGNAVGEDGIELSPNGTAPRVVEGRSGQAYSFKDNAVIAAPLDIDFETHPEITITAWIKLPAERDKAGGYLVSGGRGGASPGLLLSHHNLRAELGGARPVFYSEIPAETWTFVAGVWDWRSGTVRMHRGDASETKSARKVNMEALIRDADHQPQFPPPDDPEAEPRRHVFIGAHDMRGRSGLDGVAIDDVRIYAGLLDDERIAALSRSEPERTTATERRQLPERGESPPIDDVVGPAVEDPAMDPADITPAQPDSERAPHSVVIDGTAGPGRTRYTLRASGPLQPVEGAIGGMAVTIDQDDVVDGTGRNARGYVGDNRDGYYVYGGIDAISLIDPTAAAVYVDGERLALGDGTGPRTIRQPLEPGRGNAAEDEPESVDAEGSLAPPGELGVTPSDEGEIYLPIAGGSASRTEVTGWRLDSSLPLDLGDAALHSITWYEESDRPCDFRIAGYARGTNRFGAARTERRSVEVCNRDGGNKRSEKTVSLRDRQAVISELSSCHGSAGRIKGLRVSGPLLDGNRSLSSDDEYSAEAERSRCGRDNATASCARGSVATGLVLHIFRPDNGNRYVSGLQLICRGVAD